ncbi:hypothetical protein LCGC14_0470490 [marine sediment metagenome]|uniref:Uncharacterized protein n=1 Tax=marine sediment metagenome TaxID=412755 RepID=A0A0F9SCB9_9ZZZZ
MNNYIDILFDGPPGNQSGRFVEIEDSQKQGIEIGEWVKRGTYWALRIPDPRRMTELEDKVAELKLRLDLAVGHLNGDTCPECKNMNSVVTGCNGSCCVLCDYVDYVDSIDGGASEENQNK